MKPRPRPHGPARSARRMFYIATCGVLLVVAAMVISTMGDAQWQDSTYLCAFDLCGGAFHILFRWRALGPTDMQYGAGNGFVWTRFDARTSINMWKGTGVRPRGFIRPPWVNVIIPLWMPLALFVTGAVWARRRCRNLVGCCATCGYNLTGLPEPRCPECGRSFVPKGDAA